jgi:Na+-transporting NADH:ubiquinone oxidoreductase subunit C
VNDDGNTIYGANFSHEGETPGLGARIADKDFQDEFVDKHLFQEGEFKGVVVLKKGQKSVTGAEQIDALTGATITSLGVSAMLEDCLAPYKNFLMKLQGDNGAQPAADAAETEINDNQPE